jgi:hypothetical protein
MSGVEGKGSYRDRHGGEGKEQAHQQKLGKLPGTCFSACSLKLAFPAFAFPNS